MVEFFDVRQWKRSMFKAFNEEVNEFSWNNSGSHFFLTNGAGRWRGIYMREVDVLKGSL